MCCRIGKHRGYRVIGVDLVPERLARVAALGVETIDLREHEKDLAEYVRGLTDGRGPDSVIDAVGMEAHGSPGAALMQKMTGYLPDALAGKLMQKAGVDRLHALYLAIDVVRRGGTISLSGVYGGMADPMPMLTLFDKQIQLRMGQANVWRWIPEILPLQLEQDTFGMEGFPTHHISLAEAPDAYETFMNKEDGAIKYVINP
jgi:threonine dehydrogenase-like Zn-dependent dehydrogenase